MRRDESPNYRIAEFLLDAKEHRVTGPSQDIYLPPKTFETLLFLVSRSGHLVTKQELLDAVWPDASVTENALTRCIKEVRLALRDNVHQPRFIETVPRVGYKFIAEVEPVWPAAQVVEPASEPLIGPLAGLHDGAGDQGRTEAAAKPALPARTIGLAWKRPAITGAVIVISMILLMGTSYLFNLRSRNFPFRARDFILIADLDNQTGDPLLDKSLGTAFTVSMEQSSYANVFPQTRAAGTLLRMGKSSQQKIDEGIGREICLREKIRGLMALTVGKVGRQYALSARLIDPQTGNAVRSYLVYAKDQDHILPALQSLATSIRSDLGESLSSIEQSNLDLPQVTTPSLKALKLYSDGVLVWEKGQYSAAVQLYESAIAEDPDFARAHASLGVAYCSHVFSNPIKGKEHYEKALQLSGRLTERERQSIRINYENDLGHFEAARDLNLAYLRNYPDDFRMRYNFGYLLMNNKQQEQAILQFQEVLRLAPEYAGAYINIATCLTQLGRSSEALEYYAGAFRLEPAWETNGNLNHEYGFTLVKAGHSEKAREVFNKALAAGNKSAALRSLAMLDMYEGKYRQARQRLEDAILLNSSAKAALSESRNHLFLSMLYEGQGRRAESAAELARAVEDMYASGSAPWLAVRIAIAYIHLGDINRALGLLELARKNRDLNSPEQRSDMHRLEAELELVRGNYPESLRKFVLADNEYHTAFSVEGLARAYRMSSNTDRAVTAFEQLLGLKGESLGFEPQQQWQAAHYWLAKLYLSRGETQKARDMLGALLGIWRNADADLPLLRDAVRLMAQTEGSRFD